ncbi:MAG: hypothetical protein KGJ07_07770 [Patescibacteria group bacterium]|nr:hypothetical protein [Patescibacteria group bacterium]
MTLLGPHCAMWPELKRFVNTDYIIIVSFFILGILRIHGYRLKIFVGCEFDIDANAVPWGDGRLVVGSMDVVRCDIVKPTNSFLNYALYNGEKRKHLVKYAAITDHNGRFIKVSDMYLGRSSDTFIAGMADMAAELDHHQAVFADLAFSSMPYCITRFPHPVSEADFFFNHLIGSFRINVERTFQRLKTFKAFDSKWRHNLESHGTSFLACCNMLNIDFDYRPVVPIQHALTHALRY